MTTGSFLNVFTSGFSKHMMDFLVQVATACHLSPATHTFLLVSPQTGRTVDYLASQAVGSVGEI